MSGLGRIQQYLERGFVDWHEWDDEELELILDHYNVEGPQWCIEHLNRSPSQVYSKVKRLRKMGLLDKKKRG
jgi:predicted transcriptional regulator